MVKMSFSLSSWEKLKKKKMSCLNQLSGVGKYLTTITTKINVPDMY